MRLLGGSGFDGGVGLFGFGGGCAGGGGCCLLWLSGPDELAVLVSLGQDTYEARLAIKNSSYILWCDARIVPCGGNGQAHLVFRGTSRACVQAADVVIVLWGISWRSALLDRRVLVGNCQAESW